jgi:hypothetical protein
MIAIKILYSINKPNLTDFLGDWQVTSPGHPSPYRIENVLIDCMNFWFKMPKENVLHVFFRFPFIMTLNVGELTEFVLV